MNRSVFPSQIDTFVEHFEIQSNDVASVKRYQELKIKTTALTPDEVAELQNLSTLLREKIFTPEDFNKLQDCITNLETFFKNQVEGYITTKQNEMKTYVDTQKTSVTTAVADGIAEMTATKNTFTTFVNTKTSEISSNFTQKVTDMEDKKNYFIQYVDVKENDINAMVQEFDSRSARYLQKWSASAGQLEYPIYGGLLFGLPPEAKLDIDINNVDLIVNGTTLTPTDDYAVKPNGLYDTIVLNSSASTLIGNGTEVVAKWYKNVGKLYFKHSSTHGENGSDPIVVTEGMLDSNVKTKLNLISNKLTIGEPPTAPAFKELWIEI